MADPADGIFIGAASGGADPQYLNLTRANRHGLVAGAARTGKTVTLQGIAESFSRLGVLVFVADVKGDLSGLAMAGSPDAPNQAILAARAKDVGEQGWACADTPAVFWDLYGKKGHRVRTTISEMGPLLLSRLMNLNDTQEGVLTVAFTLADKEGLLLLDLDDLQAMLAEIANRADELSTTYGNISRTSVGTIQCALLQLRSQGAENFFGEPALDMQDFFGVDEQARGRVNILAADTLMAAPKLYATFLLWMLSELFELLLEVGDPDKPKLIFFFDEAHLLFDEAPDALLEKVEQVVQLIRSKGAGVYFITQNPIDAPDKVAAQLGNRVQHALRAFTPRNQKAIAAAAETFRANPGVDVAKAIIELKVGEALVSLLQADGSPTPVTRTLIAPPRSRVGPVSDQERALLISTSPLAGTYDTAVDKQSAAEMLAAKAGDAAAAKAAAKKARTDADAAAAKAMTDAAAQKEADRAAAAQAAAEARAQTTAAREAARPSVVDKMIVSATRAASSSIGRQIANEVGREMFGRGRSNSGGLAGQLVRGIFGNLLKG
jgi:uncharacterized protein